MFASFDDIDVASVYAFFTSFVPTPAMSLRDAAARRKTAKFTVFPVVVAVAEQRLDAIQPEAIQDVLETAAAGATFFGFADAAFLGAAGTTFSGVRLLRSYSEPMPSLINLCLSGNSSPQVDGS